MRSGRRCQCAGTNTDTGIISGTRGHRELPSPDWTGGPGPCRGNLVTCHWAGGNNNNNTVCGVRSPGQRGGARPPSGDNNSHNNNNTMWSTLPAAKNASEANGDWDCGPRSAMNLGPGARSSSFPSSRSLLLIFSELELGVACRVFRSLAPSLVLTWFPE